MAGTIFCRARAGYHCLVQCQDVTPEIMVSGGPFAPGRHVIGIGLTLRDMEGVLGREYEL
jgi:hypothetical protein